MADTRAMRVEELRGMTVLNSETGGKLGEVTDVIVHPTEGRVLGITLRNSVGEVMALAAHEMFIGVDAVMTQGATSLEAWSSESKLADGALASHDMIGTNIVTEDGRLIGQVSDIYISTETPRTFYQVAGSTLQRFLGGGFFLPGDLPRVYSTDGARMIVPPDAEHAYAASSIEEILNRPLPPASPAGDAVPPAPLIP